MSQTFYIKNSFSISGMTAASARTIIADNLINATEEIPAGISGTAGLAGEMTLPTGHGITNSDIVSVCWATGYAYDCTVSDSATNSCIVTLVEGDALPTSGAVVISKKKEIDVAVSGTTVVALYMGADVAVGTSLKTVSTIALQKNIIANGAYTWDSGCGEANPITGDAIVKAVVYNKGTTVGEAQIIVGYDNI